MKMMNSNFVFSVFHPDYFVDLLRAGGRFPSWNTFPLPSSNLTKQELRDFIIDKFPLLSEERYEIWIKFSANEEKSDASLSLEDIESAHFYSIHRQEAANPGVLHTLNVYGIQVGDPLDQTTNNLLEEYSSVIREHTASTIVKAWFPETLISRDFIAQVELGFKYQQSSAPDKLEPIPSNKIWAHLVSYNAGLRKFDERPDVLWLQDIQEVIKRTDSNFKQELKLIGDKYSSKFSELLDDAEEHKKSGIGALKWLPLKKSMKNTYLYELDIFLSDLGKQRSFFYSALLYLNWREKILDSDYNGMLGDNPYVGYFLKNTSDIDMRQSVSEALYTILYTGGPRVFQKALIEARKKILNINKIETDIVEIDVPHEKDAHSPKNLLLRLFINANKELGKLFTRIFDEFSDEKKKEVLKEIKELSLSKIKISKGNFTFEQYSKLCILFGIPEEQFEQDPLSISIVREADTINDVSKIKKTKSGNLPKTSKSKKVKIPTETGHPEINFPDAEISKSEMDKK